MLIEGKTPFVFAMDWYKPEEIYQSINRSKRLFPKVLRDSDIPEDVCSMEFAKWMAHQYALAMCKGIDIAERAIEASSDYTNRRIVEVEGGVK